MRWVALLVGVSSIIGWDAGRAQEPAGARVSGRLAILEKDNKPTTDLGDAVVYLEGPRSPARPTAIEIAINDKTFVPRVLVVPLGSTVRFTNHDPFNHNVFSASDPNTFDLGLYGRGEARSWTFTAPGLVRVYCNIHPRMVAFVQVIATRHFRQPSADGSFALENVPTGQYRIHVWHERSPEVVKEVTVAAAGVTGLELQLDARGFRWQPHKNKYGRDYPTNAGRERY